MMIVGFFKLSSNKDYLASAIQKLGTCMWHLWNDTGREEPKYSE